MGRTRSRFGTTRAYSASYGRVGVYKTDTLTYLYDRQRTIDDGPHLEATQLNKLRRVLRNSEPIDPNEMSTARYLPKGDPPKPVGKKLARRIAVEKKIGRRLRRGEPLTPQARAVIERQIAWISRFRDVGGNFDSQRITVKAQNTDIGWRQRSGGSYFITGHVFPWAPPSMVSGIGADYLTPTSKSTLMEMGAQAIQQVVPNKPHAGLLVALKELKSEGLPSLPGLKAGQALFTRDRVTSVSQTGKTIPGEYLNLEFGWKPLLNDIQDLAEAISQREELWQKFVDGANKPFTRTWRFEPTETWTMTRLGDSYGSPSGSTTLYDTRGVAWRTTHVITKRWFKGRFCYAVPSRSTQSDEAIRMAQKLRVLYGVDLTPATVWNMLPWSWLVDWATDYGNLLKALSAFGNDGLVMVYGYIMEHRVETITDSITGLKVCGIPHSPILQIVRESKLRYRASPFGFTQDAWQPTGRQLSILASIGMTR